MLQTMDDIQPGVSGVSVFKPAPGVKAAIVKVCPAPSLYDLIPWCSLAPHQQHLRLLWWVHPLPCTPPLGSEIKLAHCTAASAERPPALDLVLTSPAVHPQETEEVYEVDGTFVRRSRMLPLPGAGIAEEAGIPGVPLKAPAQVCFLYTVSNL